MVYIRVDKGMYGLPQAGLIAQQLLEKRLSEHGYRQSTTTPGFWKHDWRPISFSLVVDDFGVKYVGQEHPDHLLAALREFYVVEKNDSGDKYCGITLDWDYRKRKVHLSMPGYSSEALQRFRHGATFNKQDQPHDHSIPMYGATIQYAKKLDESPKLNKQDKQFIQQVTGTFLYYARAVDSTMLVALSAIASQQSDPTEETMRKTEIFGLRCNASSCSSNFQRQQYGVERTQCCLTLDGTKS